MKYAQLINMYIKKWNYIPNSHPAQNNPMWIKDLNVKNKIIKLWEGNKEYLYDLKVGKYFSNNTHTTQITKENKINLILLKLRTSVN